MIAAIERDATWVAAVQADFLDAKEHDAVGSPERRLPICGRQSTVIFSTTRSAVSQNGKRPNIRARRWFKNAVGHGAAIVRLKDKLSENDRI
jgi:hypothetical protein